MSVRMARTCVAGGAARILKPPRLPADQSPIRRAAANVDEESVTDWWPPELEFDEAGDAVRVLLASAQTARSAFPGHTFIASGGGAEPPGAKATHVPRHRGT